MIRLTTGIFIILLTARISPAGPAALLKEVQRFQVTEASATSVVSLTGPIPARSIGLLALAIEAPAAMALSTVTDSRANPLDHPGFFVEQLGPPGISRLRVHPHRSPSR